MPATYSRFLKELGFHIRAGYSFMVVVTEEHERLVEEVETLATKYLDKETKSGEKWNLYRWTITDGWQLKGKKLPRGAEEMPTPLSEFQKIEKFDPFSVIIMENFHFFLTKENPDLIQAVRDLSKHCQKQNKAVIFANAVLEFPVELDAYLTVLDHELPTPEDIDSAIDMISESVNRHGVDVKLNDEKRYVVRESLKGMRMTDVENALAYSIVTTGIFEPKVLLAEKCKAIKKTGLLEYVQSDETFDRIGGLDRLKKWLGLWKIAFTDKAKKFKLPTPRGVLLLGVPGCGKTLIANGTANYFSLPLIRFDMASVFGRYVGDSLSPDEEVLFYRGGNVLRLTMEEAYRLQPEGCLVQSYTEDQRCVLRPVTGFIRHRRRTPLVEVRLSSGRSVKVTEDHSLFTIGQDGMIAETNPKELSPGDPVAVPFGRISYDEVSSFDLLKLIEEHQDRESWMVRGVDASCVAAKTDSACYARHSGRARLSRIVDVGTIPADAHFCAHHGNEELGRTLVLTEDLMRFFGWFAAEGCFLKKTTRLTVHKSEAHIIEELCKKLGLEYRPYPGKGIQHATTTAIVGGVAFGRTLRYLGFGGRRLPAWIFGVAPSLRAMFLRGFFSGDGGVSGRLIEASTAYRQMASDVLGLLASIGIYAQSYSHVNKNPKWNASPETRKIIVSSGFMTARFMDVVGFDQTEKAKAFKGRPNPQWLRVPKIDAILTALKKRANTPWKRPFVRTCAKERICADRIKDVYPEAMSWELAWDRVKSVERLADQPSFVYDISVDETENFVSGFGGVLCHNSEQNMKIGRASCRERV
jgi:intein/homing endonuclease